MVPFAIKTDMFEAMKRADVKAGDVDTFLGSLLAEHETSTARASLRALWTKYIETRFPEEQPRVRSGHGPLRARAQTPPPSPPSGGVPGPGEGGPGEGGTGEGGPGEGCPGEGGPGGP